MAVVTYSRTCTAYERAKENGEKADALCHASETGVHFLMMGYDQYGQLIPVAQYPKCERCGCDIEHRGHRWVARPMHIIGEETYIEDLL